MQKDQLASFLKLYHAFGLGRISLPQLGDSCDHDYNRLCNLSDSELKGLGLDASKIAALHEVDTSAIEKELAWAEMQGNRIVCFDDDAYPELLLQITDFPALLYCSGNSDLLNSPQIAIVGSRNCTPGGASHATEFSASLASAGLTITSGMAIGIDSHAHLGALGAGGNTIAVAGTGLDRIYPSSNRQLAYNIHEKGLLVSEFPLGTSPRSENFPRRNRIISGLCVATLVVEAARRSGSLITAHQSLEQGREVFAIPGSIKNPQTRGCHQLIREGARLVEQPADIIEELASLLGFVAEMAPQERKKVTLGQEYIDLLNAMGYDPVSADSLVERSGLTIDKLSSMLLLLELNDHIQSAPGGCYVRI